MPLEWVALAGNSNYNLLSLYFEARMFVVFFFFKQKTAYEIGTVTGVQTCALPISTFIAHILERAQPGEMDSLTLIVAGAEKCPQSVFDLCHRIAPNARVVEGYGVTECAPVVARSEERRVGKECRCRWSRYQ